MNNNQIDPQVFFSVFKKYRLIIAIFCILGVPLGYLYHRFIYEFNYETSFLIEPLQYVEDTKLNYIINKFENIHHKYNLSLNTLDTVFTYNPSQESNKLKNYPFADIVNDKESANISCKKNYFGLYEGKNLNEQIFDTKLLFDLYKKTISKSFPTVSSYKIKNNNYYIKLIPTDTNSIFLTLETRNNFNLTNEELKYFISLLDNSALQGLKSYLTLCLNINRINIDNTIYLLTMAQGNVNKFATYYAKRKLLDEINEIEIIKEDTSRMKLLDNLISFYYKKTSRNITDDLTEDQNQRELNSILELFGLSTMHFLPNEILDQLLKRKKYELNTLKAGVLNIPEEKLDFFIHSVSEVNADIDNFINEINLFDNIEMVEYSYDNILFNKFTPSIYVFLIMGLLISLLLIMIILFTVEFYKHNRKE